MSTGEAQGTHSPLWEFGCLQFSAPQTETLACLLLRPAKNKKISASKRCTTTLKCLEINQDGFFSTETNTDYK